MPVSRRAVNPWTHVRIVFEPGTSRNRRRAENTAVGVGLQLDDPTGTSLRALTCVNGRMTRSSAWPILTWRVGFLRDAMAHVGSARAGAKSLSGLVGSPSDRPSDQGLQRSGLRKCWPLDTRLSVDDHTFLQLSRHFPCPDDRPAAEPGPRCGQDVGLGPATAFLRKPPTRPAEVAAKAQAWLLDQANPATGAEPARRNRSATVHLPTTTASSSSR